MESEFTGRKVKVTAELRNLADEGLARIERIVGRGASAHVILSSEKHGELAEVTVNARQHTLVGAAEASQLSVALRTAIEKAEKQAVRWKKTSVEKKRKGAPISAVLPADNGAHASDARGRSPRGAVAGAKKSGGLHIVPAPEALAEWPMTVEEAVKEAESRDQQVFVFRDPAGFVKVLHCAGDGFVRLIEVP